MKVTDAVPWIRRDPRIRISVEARKHMTRDEMNTIDCSTIGFNGLSSWFLGKPLDDSEELICSGIEDSQESARPEPRSVLRRVEPHVHEFAGAQLEKPDLEQGG